MSSVADILIVGGGIAGAAAAFRLADFGRRVILIEAEPRAPYHASARSAALGDEIYTPNADVAALTRLGAELLQSVKGATHPKGSLHLYGADDFDLCSDALTSALGRGVNVKVLSADQIAARFPYLRQSVQHSDAGLYLPPGEAFKIDVDAVFAHFRRRVRAMGGVTRVQHKLLSAQYAGGAWSIETSGGSMRAQTIINASGAWADEVAERCGVSPKGMTAYRRNVLVSPIRHHPALIGQEGPFVFWEGRKEDLYCDVRGNGEVLISSADEDPSAPCDAQPDGYNIASAAIRFEERTALELSGEPVSMWAGLRTFMPDRRPLIGWDPDVPEFFWSAAYGGFGIECCLSASLVLEAEILGTKKSQAQLQQAGVDPEAFSPRRFVRSMAWTR